MASSRGYEHSQAFASLKRLKETLSTNLTSAHYLQALDTMLLNGLVPIVRNTNCFEGFVTQLIGWQEANRKRKVSFLERDEFMQIALAWTLIDTREGKAHQVSKLKLDRAAVFEFLRSFVEATVDYVQACSGLLTVNGIVLPLGDQQAYIARVEEAFESLGPLLPHVHEARRWVKYAEQFKELIVEKYVRLCLQTAQADYANYFETEANLDDMVQNYLLAASRAIDKCDPNQGVLTSYVQFWLKTARAQQLGVRKQEAATSSSDDEAYVEPEGSFSPELSSSLEQDQLIEEVRQIARLVDPEGYGRAYLGILESTEFLESSC